MNKFILAYDLGTTAVKVSLFSLWGEIISSAISSYKTFYPRLGWAEQDPDAWWEAIRKATRGLIAQVPGAKKDIATIGISGHMLGCLPVDRKGKPLRRAMIHSDTRAVHQWKNLEKILGKEEIYKITGNRIVPHSSICKICYLKEEEKDIYKKTAKFLQSKDYITYKLTGRLGITDYSDASHSVLLDIEKKVWSDVLLEATGIDRGKLPEIHPSADIIGKLGKEQAEELDLISGIPVVAGGGDGACASVGAGAVKIGDTYNYIGGTAWIATTLNRPFIDPKMRVFNILGLDPAKCGIFGTMQCAGSAYQWVADLMGEADFENLNRLAERAEPGSKGLFFLPYLMGERSPIWNPYARGVYFGLTLSHKREDLVRSTLEGVGFALRSILEVIEKVVEVKAIRLIGGGAKSEVWRNILANIYGKRLEVLRMQGEATSYGAAIAAGVGVGLFKDYEIAAKIIKKEKDYHATKEVHQRYSRFFDFYKSLYSQLKPSFHSLRQIITKEEE